MTINMFLSYTNPQLANKKFEIVLKIDSTSKEPWTYLWFDTQFVFLWPKLAELKSIL